MVIKESKLDIMASRRSQYPQLGFPEFLLVGRSNVGKSSFINAVLIRKELAHTSSKPGKTKTLNFYLVNNEFYFIDAPGYGYAAVDKKTQAKFGKLIEEYLENRKELRRVFMLVDMRHKPTEDDVLMYNYLKYYNLPVTIIATKSDKVGTTRKERQLKLITNTLDLVVGDDVIVFSSSTKEGRDELLKKLEDLIIETI